MIGSFVGINSGKVSANLTHPVQSGLFFAYVTGRALATQYVDYSQRSLRELVALASLIPIEEQPYLADLAIVDEWMAPALPNLEQYSYSTVALYTAIMHRLTQRNLAMAKMFDYGFKQHGRH